YPTLFRSSVSRTPHSIHVFPVMITLGVPGRRRRRRACLWPWSAPGRACEGAGAVGLPTMGNEGVHEICDRYVDEVAAGDPIAATDMGISGYDDQLTDFSPEGHAARAEAARRTLREVAAATTDRPGEESAQAVFTERTERELELHEAGLDIAQLNPISSPVQMLRMIFDLMPTQTEADWATVARRLDNLPAALDGVRT